MFKQAHTKSRGFSLVEMMFAVAIVCVLAAVSMPALGSLVHNARSRSANTQLVASLNLARITASTRQSEVVLCASSDQIHCDSGLWWQHGWIVFQDLNKDGKRSDDEPLISIMEAQPGMAIASTSGRIHITYRPDGSATGTNVTMTLCDQRGPKYAGAVVISNSGRPRQGKPTASEAAIVCAGL
jgi:type IV fimbrial biogenesis protein FimT